MSASVLPPMTGDDLTLTRQLFTYLTSPDPTACQRLATLGGTTVREGRGERSNLDDLRMS